MRAKEKAKQRKPAKMKASGTVLGGKWRGLGLNGCGLDLRHLLKVGL